MASIPEEDMDIDAGASNASEDWQLPKIDYSNVDTNDDTSIASKFTKTLDQLDNRVEILRKDALHLQEKRDALLMSIDVIKNDAILNDLDEYATEDIICYIKRISERLATVDLNVTTVRDSAQEDALHQVNVFIDSIIINKDRVMARQRCQTFLNCCTSNINDALSGNDRNIDKNFELALLGCSLDDQKIIKKRLTALMTYLNKQTVSE